MSQAEHDVLQGANTEITPNRSGLKKLTPTQKTVLAFTSTFTLSVPHTVAFSEHYHQAQNVQGGHQLIIPDEYRGWKGVVTRANGEEFTLSGRERKIFGDEEKNPNSIPFTIAEEGYEGYPENPKRRIEIANTWEEYEAIMERAGLKVKEEYRKILRTKTLIYVGDEEKPYTGFDIKTNEIKYEDNRVLIIVEMKDPSENDVGLQILNNPHQVLLVDKDDTQGRNIDAKFQKNGEELEIVRVSNLVIHEEDKSRYTKETLDVARTYDDWEKIKKVIGEGAPEFDPGYIYFVYSPGIQYDQRVQSGIIEAVEERTRTIVVIRKVTNDIGAAVITSPFQVARVRKLGPAKDVFLKVVEVDNTTGAK